MKNKILWAYIILLFHFLAVIGYHYFGYIGHYGYDDLHYARLANDLNNGITDYNDHYSYRITLIFLTSVSYSIFGVNDTASSIPPIFVTFLVLYLIFLVLRRHELSVLATGLALTTFSNWLIFYSDKLMPDIYVVFSVMFILYTLYRYKFTGKKNHTILYSVLFSAGIISGFISKETIVLVFPLIAYLFVTDLLFKRDLKFWIYSVIFTFILFSAYLAIIWSLTGNILSRFQAITGNSYLNLCSYDSQPLIILLKRIGYQFFLMLISQAMMPGLIFVILSFCRKNIKDHFKLNNQFSFFLVSTAILFLSANFMSISVTHYIPMCLDPRHYLYLIPVAAIPASQIISRFFRDKRFIISFLISLIFLSVVSYLNDSNAARELYLPMFILFLLYYVTPQKFRLHNIFILLFILVQAIIPLKMIMYAHNVKYGTQKKLVFDHFINKDLNCYVITNDVQKRLGEYYNKFEKNPGCIFLSYNSFNPDSLESRDKYILRNWYTEYLSGLDHNDLPVYAKSIQPADNMIYNNTEMKFSIIKINKLVIPGFKTNEIVHSLNGFEKHENYWTLDNADITDKFKYEGEHSLIVHEYSSTFVYSTDSLNLEDYDEIIIESKVFCFTNDRTSSKLVISLESKEGSYIWQSADINKYIKAYSNWWPVKFELCLPAKDIKENSSIKVFVWNNNKENIYLDNFDVKINKVK